VGPLDLREPPCTPVVGEFEVVCAGSEQQSIIGSVDDSSIIVFPKFGTVRWYTQLYEQIHGYEFLPLPAKTGLQNVLSRQ